MAITGNNNSGLSTPIESYIRYFNDMKPYHTKILEILEQYNFSDSMTVSVAEELLSDYTFANRELCDNIEVFEDFDDGFTFNNTYTIVGFDNATDSVFLAGNVTGDWNEGDAIVLLNSLTHRPVVTEVTSVSLGSGRTELGVALNIASGEYDTYQDAGKEYCNLFTSIAGFGDGPFDDDQIVSAAPFAVAPTPGASEVVLSGNYSYDQRFQIISIPSATRMIVAGDVTSLINDVDVATDGQSTAFRIVPKRTFDITACTANTFSVAGDRSSLFVTNKEFEVLGTGPNDGRYAVVTASYDGNTDRTTVRVSASQVVDPSYCDGIISVSAAARNLGFYSVDFATFNGTNTVIGVDASTPFRLTDVSEAGNHGSLMLRTAMSNRRIVSLEGTNTVINKRNNTINTFEDQARSGETAGGDYDFDSDLLVSPDSYDPQIGSDVLPEVAPIESTTQTDFDYTVDFVTYDADTDRTTVTLRGRLPATITGTTLNLIGNFGFGGYDGPEDVNDPRDTHVYATIGEDVLITLESV